MKSLFVAAFFVLCASVALAADIVGDPAVYKEVDDRELKLYVSKPSNWKETDQRPALVFFHGGGWVGGTPASFNEHCKYFASRGLVTITVEYRLLKGKSADSPLVCVQDAKSAMRWVRSHAKELGIDPKRIGAAGGSAGGHLAAFCGMVEGKDDPKDDPSVSPKPNALVLFNPVFNNGPGQWGHARVGEQYKEFSPAHNITRDDPPAIIFLGSKDHLISVETTKAFQTEMQSLGIDCEFHVSEGQGHGFYHFSKSNGKNYFETVTNADKFLAKLGWLKGEPTLKLLAPTEATNEKKPKKNK